MGLYWPLTDEHLAWAVRGEDEALATVLSWRIAQWRKYGRLRSLISRWIPAQVERCSPERGTTAAVFR